jgi:hypothetical protein
MSEEFETFQMKTKSGNPAALIFLKNGHQCKCGHMAMILVNRGGKTYCSVCDPGDDNDT